MKLHVILYLMSLLSFGIIIGWCLHSEYREYRLDQGRPHVRLESNQ